MWIKSPMELNFLSSLKPTHVFSFIFYHTSKSFILRCSPELFGKDFRITSYCSNNSLKDSFFFHFLICYFQYDILQKGYENRQAHQQEDVILI